MELIINKFKDPHSIDKVLFDSIMEGKRDEIIELLISKSYYKNETNYFTVFKNIVSHFSIEKMKEIFDEPYQKDLFIRYILKNGCADFNKTITILQEYGVDVYDMAENEY